jgi:hypothetical protein
VLEEFFVDKTTSTFVQWAVDRDDVALVISI